MPSGSRARIRTRWLSPAVRPRQKPYVAVPRGGVPPNTSEVIVRTNMAPVVCSHQGGGPYRSGPEEVRMLKPFTAELAL